MDVMSQAAYDCGVAIQRSLLGKSGSCGHGGDSPAQLRKESEASSHQQTLCQPVCAIGSIGGCIAQGSMHIVPKHMEGH